MIVFDYSAAWKTFWIVAVLVWNLPWKGVALWKAARRKEVGWFILIFLVQTMAILEIFYLFWIVRENKNNYKKARKWWKKKR
jgi:hypothetical protein